MSTSAKLFSPIQVGALSLQHRIVLPPLTRLRSPDRVPTDMAVEYYAQRASTPGTLLIAEGTLIAPESGWAGTPGIWSDAQVTAWKKVTDAVHAKGSFIYLQLFALGRAADPPAHTGAGNIPRTPDAPAPRPLTVTEIKDYVGLYATAARNAVHKAGFDGVEVDAANGYLLDQFLQTNSNNRTDDYGGSVENRLRFLQEVMSAVVDAVGAERTGIRLSPWSPYEGMGMLDPVPTFSVLVSWLGEHHDKLAYLHLIEPRISGAETREGELPEHESNQFLRDIWTPRPLILAGGFTRDSAIKEAEEGNFLIAFGRNFISNPDLPLRLKNGIDLTPYNRATFYTPGPVGYTDYTFAA